jgi:signal transduction histidine kinase
MTALRVLGFAMACGVGVIAAATSPHDTLAVTVTAVVFATASAVTLLWLHAPRGVTNAGLVMAAASGVLLTQLDPRSVPLALFLVGAMGPVVSPAWVGSGIVTLAVGLYVAAEVAQERGSWTLAATASGVLFFTIVGRLALTERAQRTRIARLLAELEASRALEAEAQTEAARARMARDLHDVLAHTLSGLALHLETARLLASNTATDPALRGAVETAHRLSRTGLDEARRAVRALRGEERPGLTALEALVEEHRLASGTPCPLLVAADPARVPADVQEALYRSAQEALSNVRRHAPGAAARVQVEELDGLIVLTVDNDPAARVSGGTTGTGAGWGLAGMAERAQLLGGTVEAAPSADPPGGFRVRVTVPLSSSASP